MSLFLLKIQQLLMLTTKLGLDDVLPLTCSRAGVCCHGNVVMLNPWELYTLAKGKKISSAAFRDQFCDLGGIQLKFDGEAGWEGKKSCSQYVPNAGCSVHKRRPLACRLFPLGRQVQNNQVEYMHQGDTFPCLKGCAEVVDLPKMTVKDYLNGQETADFEQAQDGYLEIMQNLADMAFAFLLDSGLAASGDKKTVALWRKMGNENPKTLIKRIDNHWLSLLIVPFADDLIDDPVLFLQKHNALLEEEVNKNFGKLSRLLDCHEAAVLLMALALQLARGLGADVEGLANYWSDIAKEHGA